MDLENKKGDYADVYIGPYKATRLWNDVVSTFRQGVPCGRHRRYMRAAENCFVGSAAVDWLLNHLRHNINFGPDVTRKQTVQLLNKFYKAGIFEEVQVSRRGRNKQDFSDSNRLYRLLPPSPSKSTRAPLVTGPSTNVQSSVTQSEAKGTKKDEEGHSYDADIEIHKKRNNSRESVREKPYKLGAPAKSPLDSLPQCHLVGRILTLPEIGEVWKTAALSRLKKILGENDLNEVLQGYKVDGINVRHNCIFNNKNGVVTNIPPEDQLPHWVMSAMKCLARWPEKVEGDLPSYPGFEKDVFGVVRDYFLGLPEPLISYNLYDVITNVFVQVGNQIPRHSSPYASASADQNHLTHSLWSSSSLENIILDLARKYCMRADSRIDLADMAHSQAEQSHPSRGDSDWSHCIPQSSLCEERVTKALQVVCLFLPPASRRKLQFLLKLLSKMAANSLLVLDHDQSTRSLVLGTFQKAVLCSPEEPDLDEVLVLQLLSFMVDHHAHILAVPQDMKDAVEDRLRALEKPQIVYSPRDPGSLRFCRPTTVEQYETTKQEYSRQALFSLLDTIVRDQNMSEKEKKRRLKQFQRSHPDIYKQRFPSEESANPPEHQPKIKPPLLSKPLLRLKGLRI
ncbi:DEP domain-containing protein 1B-like isoform X3 [Pomacea canaliculata]|uniref:DEP domain-containing protein 1B-like isoform X3 n=1 Tax=Pomacea canaliculata TaxID=400727 RepID=UPI000D731363|nr:DEP domain-containing protein 1B-like isoform X3 [Pomacea canaliculata]